MRTSTLPSLQVLVLLLRKRRLSLLLFVLALMFDSCFVLKLQKLSQLEGSQAEQVEGVCMFTFLREDAQFSSLVGLFYFLTSYLAQYRVVQFLRILSLAVLLLLFGAVLAEHSYFKMVGLLPGNFEADAFWKSTEQVLTYVAPGNGVYMDFFLTVVIHLLLVIILASIFQCLIAAVQQQMTTTSDNGTPLLPSTRDNNNNENNNNKSNKTSANSSSNSQSSSSSWKWPRSPISLLICFLCVSSLLFIQMFSLECVPPQDPLLQKLERNPYIRLCELSYQVYYPPAFSDSTFNQPPYAGEFLPPPFDTNTTNTNGTQATYSPPPPLVEEVTKVTPKILVQEYSLPPVEPEYVGPKDSPKPNVFVVILESTRAGVISPYVPGLDSTPFYSWMAGEGTLFEKFYSVKTYTNKLMLSFLCGRGAIMDSALYYYYEADLLGANCLPQLFGRAGYKTMVASPHSLWDHSEQILASLKWQTILPERNSKDNGIWDNFPGNDALYFQKVAPWFKENRDSPMFAVLSPQGTHNPFRGYESCYSRPKDWSKWADQSHWKSGAAEKLAKFNNYVSSIQCQSQIIVENLVKLTQELGIYNHSIFFVMGDHGFEIFETHKPAQGYTCHSNLCVRVPAILMGPGIPRGKVIPNMVSTTDFYPTILNLTHIRIPKAYARRVLDSPRANLLHPTVKDPVIFTNTVDELLVISEDIAIVENLQAPDEKSRYEYHFNDFALNYVFDPGQSPLMKDEVVRKEHEKRINELVMKGKIWWRDHSWVNYFQALGLPGASEPPKKDL